MRYVDNDTIGKELRKLWQSMPLYIKFNGYHNGKNGSYDYEPGYHRYIRFRTRTLEVTINYLGRNKYNVTVLDLNCETIDWSKSLTLSKFRELFLAIRTSRIALVEFVTVNESDILEERVS